MKKLLITGILGLAVLLPGIPAKADLINPMVPPSVSDQFMASLTKSMVVVGVHTSHNQNKVEALDNLLQFGHYDGSYIVGVDFGIIGNTDSMRKTYGVNVRIVPLVLANVPMNPTLHEFLSHAFITPRYSFDEDDGHGVLGYTFGAEFGF